MAGAGFKTFNTGDVLTASDVNTYLMQQTVMVFADATARSTALGANVAEGMYSYLKSTKATEYYNGSAWTNIDTSKSPLTTKGDIWGFSTTDARIPVGSNGQVLTADSTQTLGVKWAAAGGVPTINWVRLTSGTSWSVPSGIKYATIWAIGGGGGGGSARGDGNKYGGGGGGAGGLQMGTFDLSSKAGSTISYSIGAGGNGGAQTTGTGNAGSNGGNTTFGTVGDAWYLSATGGGAGGTGATAGGATGGCGGGNSGSNVSAGAGGGGGGIGSPGTDARPYPITGNAGSGTQGNFGGNGGRGDQATASGQGGGGIFINNYGVGGGGAGGYLQGNGYVNTSAFGAVQPTVGADSGAATANTGAGGCGGTNASGNNTGYGGGAGGSGVIFIEYLS